MTRRRVAETDIWKCEILHFSSSTPPLPILAPTTRRRYTIQLFTSKGQSMQKIWLPYKFTNLVMSSRSFVFRIEHSQYCLIRNDIQNSLSSKVLDRIIVCKRAVAYVSHGCTRVFRCSEGMIVIRTLIRYFVYYLNLVVGRILMSA